MMSSFVIDMVSVADMVSKSSAVQFYTGISYWLWEAVLTGQNKIDQPMPSGSRGQ